MNTARLLALLNTSESGSLTPSGRSSPAGGRSRVRSISACSSVLPSRETRALRPQLLPRVPQRGVDVGRRSGSARRRAGTRPAPPRSARRRRAGGRGRSAPARRAAARDRARRARSAIVGMRADRLGVLDDRAVVVLRALGLLARRERRRRGAARHEQGGQRRREHAGRPPKRQRRRSPAVDDIGSARDLERERLIGQSDVFLEIGELERRRPPWLSAAVSVRICSVPAIDDDLQPVVVALRQLRLVAAARRCRAAALG